MRTEKEKDDTHQKKMRIIEIATPESSAADRTSTGTIRSGRPVRKGEEYGGNRPSQASGQSTSKRRMASGDKNSAPRYHHHPVPVESSRVGSGGGRPDVSVERRRGGGAEGSMSADIHSHGLSQRLSPSSTIVPKTHSYTSSTTRNGGGGSHTGR